MKKEKSISQARKPAGGTFHIKQSTVDRLRVVAEIIGIPLDEYVERTLSGQMDDIHDGRKVMEIEVCCMDYATKREAQEAVKRGQKFDGGNLPVEYVQYEDGEWRVEEVNPPFEMAA